MLIITENFVEAADLCDAVGGAAAQAVLHLRDMAEAAPFLADPAFRPGLAFINFRRDVPDLDKVVEMLRARNCSVALIDAPVSFAESFGAEALPRPYSVHDLTRLLARFTIDPDPDMACSPNPA